MGVLRLDMGPEGVEFKARRGFSVKTRGGGLLGFHVSVGKGDVGGGCSGGAGAGTGGVRIKSGFPSSATDWRGYISGRAIVEGCEGRVVVPPPPARGVSLQITSMGIRGEFH
jgi:hypothetical protein